MQRLSAFAVTRQNTIKDPHWYEVRGAPLPPEGGSKKSLLKLKSESFLKLHLKLTLVFYLKHSQRSPLVCRTSE